MNISYEKLGLSWNPVKVKSFPTPLEQLHYKHKFYYNWICIWHTALCWVIWNFHCALLKMEFQSVWIHCGTNFAVVSQSVLFWQISHRHQSEFCLSKDCRIRTYKWILLYFQMPMFSHIVITSCSCPIYCSDNWRKQWLCILRKLWGTSLSGSIANHL